MSEQATIWYQLFDEDRNELGSVDAIVLASNSQLFQFRKQVKADNPNKLSHADASDLKVFKNSKEKQPLAEDAPIGKLGERLANALCVVVVPNPNMHGMVQTAPVWIVTGSVTNALRMKGIRLKLYKLSSTYLGYYDGNKPAFFYNDDNDGTLAIRALFKTEENALKFENNLQNEKNTHNSPMSVDQCEIETKVTAYSSGSATNRIFYHHYAPEETTSPLDTLSQISDTTSVLDQSRDIFKYQRLESESIFGMHYKACSCHIISAAQCRNSPDRYGRYDRDENNRLALSRDVHGFFDGDQVDVPLFDLKVIDTSRGREFEGRYRIKFENYLFRCRCCKNSGLAFNRRNC